jgi:orotate phosphoribosyltransferase
MDEELLTALRGLGFELTAPKEEDVPPRYIARVSLVLPLERLFPYPRIVDQVCKSLASPFLTEGGQIFAVAGISQHQNWGGILAHGVARHLSMGLSRDVLVVNVCRKSAGTDLVIEPGPQANLRKQRIVVVSDVLATGTTVTNLIAKLRVLHAHIVGVTAIGDRKDVMTTLPPRVSYHSLFDVVLEPVKTAGVKK